MTPFNITLNVKRPANLPYVWRQINKDISRLWRWANSSARGEKYSVSSQFEILVKSSVQIIKYKGWRPHVDQLIKIINKATCCFSPIYKMDHCGFFMAVLLYVHKKTRSETTVSADMNKATSIGLMLTQGLAGLEPHLWLRVAGRCNRKAGWGNINDR